MSDPTTPQQLIDLALAASTVDDCIVIAHAGTTLNLRWANNTLTTNGAAHTGGVSVVAIVNGVDGPRAASISRSGVDASNIAALVAEAEAAATDSLRADDAAPLFSAVTSPDFGEAPERPEIESMGSMAAWLGDNFAAAEAAGDGRFGYAEHEVDTLYLASSSGLRLRHVQPAVRLEITGRSRDGSRSAWAGQSVGDPALLDLDGLEADVARRLAWSKRQVSMPAGRYETILPPSAVADLFVYMYWDAMSALGAHEGSSVFSAPGGTRVGDVVASPAVTVRSDPSMATQQCLPFVATASSSRMASVFDNGMPLMPTDWIANGTLKALHGSRHVADKVGAGVVAPYIDNLELIHADGHGDVERVIADTERGLLLTCVWYVRAVDPASLLLTGLTRDGVFLVEHGEVVGAVNNFRFNESPVSLLSRITDASMTVDTFPREFGDGFTRARMPALRVSDFNMSSVSQAS